ncbi:MAG: hypothetical protein J7L53_03380 [Deltaproteobacteria bacterium]|nr:hypothetical protein [Deltaproteobacteria bacterium]
MKVQALFLSAISLIILATANTGIAQTVTIPPMPFWDNPTIEIDETLILQLASDYCSDAGGEASSPAFFLGYLPLWSVDELCQISPDKAQISKFLGNLYISGYFGGVWLRDALSTNNVDPENVSMPLKQAMPEALREKMELGNDALIFYALTCLVGGLIDVALEGYNSLIFIANRLSIEPFLMLYGYNWGYLDFMLENPPDGIVPPDDLIICNRFLDCQMPDAKLVTLTQYKPVLDKLYTPPIWRWWDSSSWKWLEMRTALEIWGKGSVAAGEGVWEHIMSDSELSEPAYNLLIDLSARFLLVAELSLLPTMEGYAEYDGDAGGCGLLQEAGMIMWAASYFMGLHSLQPEGTFPELCCP